MLALANTMEWDVAIIIKLLFEFIVGEVLSVGALLGVLLLLGVSFTGVLLLTGPVVGG
jgi:hypothetical protein